MPYWNTGFLDSFIPECGQVVLLPSQGVSISQINKLSSWIEYIRPGVEVNLDSVLSMTVNGFNPDALYILLESNHNTDFNQDVDKLNELGVKNLRLDLHSLYDYCKEQWELVFSDWEVIRELERVVLPEDHPLRLRRESLRKAMNEGDHQKEQE